MYAIYAAIRRSPIYNHFTLVDPDCQPPSISIDLVSYLRYLLAATTGVQFLVPTQQ
jgi:hypothetical protein